MLLPHRLHRRLQVRHQLQKPLAARQLLALLALLRLRLGALAGARRRRRRLRAGNELLELLDHQLERPAPLLRRLEAARALLSPLLDQAAQLRGLALLLPQLLKVRRAHRVGLRAAPSDRARPVVDVYRAQQLAPQRAEQPFVPVEEARYAVEAAAHRRGADRVGQAEPACHNERLPQLHLGEDRHRSVLVLLGVISAQPLLQSVANRVLGHLARLALVGIQQLQHLERGFRGREVGLQGWQRRVGGQPHRARNGGLASANVLQQGGRLQRTCAHGQSIR